jgi:hypothetical protein
VKTGVELQSVPLNLNHANEMPASKTMLVRTEGSAIFSALAFALPPVQSERNSLSHITHAEPTKQNAPNST